MVMIITISMIMTRRVAIYCMFFFKPKGALSLTFFERVQIVDLLAVDIHIVKGIKAPM